MFARSASLAVMALLGLHGIDMVDAKVLVGGSSLPGLRAQAGTPAPSASPVSPQPTLPVPTGSPSDSPAPSPAPSDSPTVKPPTTSPSASPAPSPSPSSTPTLTKMPTPFPTSGPPTVAPVVTAVPSASPKPSPSPSGSPSTPAPTTTPSDSPQPSPGPTRNTPTGVPTKTLAPSGSPSGSPKPSPMPTTGPTPLVSAAPSKSPKPTGSPTASPAPSPGPTLKPTTSKQPTPGPTALPTVSNEPSLTTVPSMTFVPSLGDTVSAEPSVSNVPSSTPSGSQEPSVSDVPTTSSSPTVNPAAYVDITASWQGDSTVRIIVVNDLGAIGGGVITCTGSVSQTTLPFNMVPSTNNGVVGDPAQINTINVKCPFTITSNEVVTEMYQFVIQQETDNEVDLSQNPVLVIGTQQFYDLTVDFKVGGETVEGLSGVFKSTTTATNQSNAGDINFNTFTFTNSNDGTTFAGEVVATQLEPTRKADFLTFTVGTDTTAETLALEILNAPASLDGTAPCTETSTETQIVLTCSAFSFPGGEYRFRVTVTDDDGADGFVTADIPVVTVADGTTVTPGFVIPIGTDLAEDITVLYQYRADTLDSTVVAAQLDWPFLLTATTTTTRRQMLRSPSTADDSHRSLQTGLTLSLASPAAIANCVVAGPVMTSPSTSVTYIFCEQYVPGLYVFTVTSGAVSPVYDVFYDGAKDTTLSATDMRTDETRTFTFTAPTTRGEPLLDVMIDSITPAPSASLAPSMSVAPTPM